MYLFGILILSLFSFGQQGAPQPAPATPRKVLTPEQKAHPQQAMESMEKHQHQQAQAKQIFDAEMAREKAVDCPDANTAYDFNICYGKQGTTTEQNLSSFEGIIRELLAPAPEMPAAETGEPVTGVAGPILVPHQLAAEFDHVEQSWRQYRDTACTAAFHQFGGGTGGPSFELQCELKLARDHMRELDMIYGCDLHL
jgi:uncharacterized protein YecT (DUF1311 family)